MPATLQPEPRTRKVIDRRIVYVELTEKGKNLTDQIRNKHIVSFNKWYSKASEKEKEYILNGLNCVIDALISD